MGKRTCLAAMIMNHAMGTNHMDINVHDNMVMTNCQTTVTENKFHNVSTVGKHSGKANSREMYARDRPAECGNHSCSAVATFNQCVL